MSVKFVDLFCGIGGFHHALSDLGHECVFACDTDKHCREVYQENWDMTVFKDIRDWVDEIDDHDFLCAGFPCQPFSKSGSQAGFQDKIRGTLFDEICKIIKKNNPTYLLLENVPNMRTHDDGNTMKTIRSVLQELGYYVKDQVLSPHQFGIPQHRPRLFIAGFKKSKVKNFSKFRFPTPNPKNEEIHIDTIHDINSKGSIPDELVNIFNHWTEFLSRLPLEVKPPSPTWSMEFGRTYELDGIHPLSKLKKEQIVSNLQKEGIICSMRMTKKQLLSHYPPYVRNMTSELPTWKKRFILKNRQFWEDYKHKIGNEWLDTTRTFSDTHQKFEWHVGASKSRDLLDYMIHLRPSGIRVSKLDRIPALVAISQIPIIGPWMRKLTPREAANAQSFRQDFVLHQKDSLAYKQLGNTVNVKIVKLIAMNMLFNNSEIKKKNKLKSNLR